MKDFVQKLEGKKLFEYMIQGVERECLRVDQKGFASKKPHPLAFGSKLTHPYITTDYSENLLEFITRPHKNLNNLYRELLEIHSFVLDKNPDELLWPCSMPALLPASDDDIDVADYGTSNVGMLKKTYRVGLGHRYGKKMQSIAGIHFNFSFTDDFWSLYQKETNSSLSLQELKNEGYFALIRNYKRFQWILTYLFGASANVDESFLVDRAHNLKRLNSDSFGLEKATSLRMGGLGYTSDAQDEIMVCYNALITYLATLETARLKSMSDYEKIGVQDQEDNYLQLNTNLLQIDNEFYSTIRPKRTAKSKESALQALARDGVEYIELRILDVNPFDKLGVSVEQMKFLQLFMASCFLTESPDFDVFQYNKSLEDLSYVVKQGQSLSPELKKEIQFVFDSMEALLPLFDESYKEVFLSEAAKLKDPKNTFSSQLLELSKNSYKDFMLNLAKEHKAEIVNSKFHNKLDLDSLVEKSLSEQTQLEQSDELSFGEFLNNYFESIKIKDL